MVDVVLAAGCWLLAAACLLIIITCGLLLLVCCIATTAMLKLWWCYVQILTTNDDFIIFMNSDNFVCMFVLLLLSYCYLLRRWCKIYTWSMISFLRYDHNFTIEPYFNSYYLRKERANGRLVHRTLYKRHDILISVALSISVSCFNTYVFFWQGLTVRLAIPPESLWLLVKCVYVYLVRVMRIIRLFTLVACDHRNNNWLLFTFCEFIYYRVCNTCGYWDLSYLWKQALALVLQTTVS